MFFNKHKINEDYVPDNSLSSDSLLYILTRLFYNINPKLTLYNEAVAYVTMSIIKKRKIDSRLSKKNLLLLCLTHTIGFYKFNSTESNFDFFSRASNKYYLFSYHYLKSMTPLKDIAKATTLYNEFISPNHKTTSVYEEYANILFFSARIVNHLLEHPFTTLPADITLISPGKICDTYIDFFKEANVNHTIENKLQDKSYLDELFDEIHKIKFRSDENRQLLKFLIYAYDFKSTSILSHSINVACYATAIAKRCRLKKEQIDRIYTTALLHDIGKIVIPPHILDRAQKLDSNMKTIVQEHVIQTRKILSKCIPEDMLETAYQHHERLDGTGYPQNLTAESLSTAQRILAIADITSGLTDTRTYKISFPKEKTIRMLQDQAARGEIDKRITHLLIANFDKIHDEVEKQHGIFASDYAKIMEDYNNELAELEEPQIRINA